MNIHTRGASFLRYATSNKKSIKISKNELLIHCARVENNAPRKIYGRTHFMWAKNRGPGDEMNNYTSYLQIKKLPFRVNEALLNVAHERSTLEHIGAHWSTLEHIGAHWSTLERLSIMQIPRSASCNSADRDRGWGRWGGVQNQQVLRQPEPEKYSDRNEAAHKSWRSFHFSPRKAQ
jgi:hypothetical protein